MVSRPSPERLDQFLVETHGIETRSRAARLIRDGFVRINGRVCLKPGIAVREDSSVEILPDWISRAGRKLDHALQVFGIDPAGLNCLDLGASTGGFTQVLLHYGAAGSYAVDVGKGQLHARLKADARVRVYEQTDAREVDCYWPENGVDLITADLSFISLGKALPPVLEKAGPGTRLITLIKPQFEAGRGHVGKGGIVRDRGVYEQICARIKSLLEGHSYITLGLEESPVRGGDGNREFLIAAVKKKRDEAL